MVMYWQKAAGMPTVVWIKRPYDWLYAVCLDSWIVLLWLYIFPLHRFLFPVCPLTLFPPPFFLLFLLFIENFFVFPCLFCFYMTTLTGFSSFPPLSLNVFQVSLSFSHLKITPWHTDPPHTQSWLGQVYITQSCGRKMPLFRDSWGMKHLYVWVQMGGLSTIKTIKGQYMIIFFSVVSSLLKINHWPKIHLLPESLSLLSSVKQKHANNTQSQQFIGQ